MRNHLALLTLALAALGAQQSRGLPLSPGWTPEAMIRIPRVGDVRVSPDGQRVLYTLTVPVIEAERSEYRTEVHLVKADGTGDETIFSAGRSASSPRWLPDGSGFSYIWSRSGKSQVFVKLLGTSDVGNPDALRNLLGEDSAVQVTTAPEGVSAYAWSPDGKLIAYLVTEAPSAAKARAAREKDDAFWVDDSPSMSRLYVRGRAGLDRLLTPGSFNTTAQFDWSPDGRSLVFARTPTPAPDDTGRSDLAVVNVESGVITTLAATPVAESDPKYSPDGKSIAFTLGGEVPRWTTIARLAVIPASGGKPRLLPETFDSRPTLLGWNAGGTGLLFTETRGTLTRLSEMPLDGSAPKDLYTGPELLSGFSLSSSRTHLSGLKETPDQAPEAAVLPVGAAPRAVTAVGAGLPKFPVGKTEVIRWKSEGKWVVEGLLTYPVGYQPGTRVPLLVSIHGGPAGAFSQSFTAKAGLYPIAAFSARGYAVLSPNVRGSTGYGKRFQDQNHRDWGGSDYRDLMSGVDHVIKLGVADPERLGIMGWSYGGYLSGWTITQTHRFKAASFGAGVSNMISQTGTTDIPSARLNYFEVWPWEDPKLYLSISPLLHVKNVTTPVLIMHGEKDPRVPITQSYEYYHALKRCGVPAKMLVLPRQGHGPSEPKMLLRVMNENLAWFDQHLRP